MRLFFKAKRATLLYHCKTVKQKTVLLYVHYVIVNVSILCFIIVKILILTKLKQGSKAQDSLVNVVPTDKAYK